MRTKITPLQRLLLEHMEATGDSFNAIAKRGGLPRQTVQAILYRSGSSVPQEATMRKLAKGLGVPLQLVHEAVAQGLTDAKNGDAGTLRTLEQDPLLLALMSEASELDATQREVLVELAKTMRRLAPAQPPIRARAGRRG